MSNDESRLYVNFSSPANRQVLAFLHITEPEKATVYAPEEVDTWKLGTHPDLVDYFWGLLKKTHPGCACVINQQSRPLLVHPTSGIIFALAQGTGVLAVRLPEPERTSMLAVPGYGAEHKFPDTTSYAKNIGDDWVLLKPFDSSNAAMCQKAFAYAGTLK